MSKDNPSNKPLRATTDGDAAGVVYAPVMPSSAGPEEKGSSALHATLKSTLTKRMNSDTALREDASTMRMNEQCFLMDHLQQFAVQAPRSFAGLKVFTGQTSEMKRILALQLGQKSFMHLRPNQMALLVPELAIYLVKAGAHNMNKDGVPGERLKTSAGNIRKVDFANTATDSVMQDLLNPRSPVGTLRGATLNEFFYEITGDSHMGGAGTKDASEVRQVTLKFSGESLAALSHRVSAKQSASILDLMMNPAAKITHGGMEVINENFFMVRVAFGYKMPDDMTRFFSVEQQNSIRRCKEFMIINQRQPPKLDFKEDGSVGVELSYLARVEQDPFKGTGLFDDAQPHAGKHVRERKVSTQVRSQAHIDLDSSKKQYADQLKRMIQRMDTEDYNKWFEGEDYSESDLIERAKHDQIINTAKSGATSSAAASKLFKNKEYDDEALIAGTNKKIDWNKKQAALEIQKTAEYARRYKQALAASEVIQGGDRAEKYSRVMSWLLDQGKVSTILVPKEMLGVTTHGDPRLGGTHYATLERQRLRSASAKYMVAEQNNQHTAWWQLSQENMSMNGNTYTKYLVQSGLAPDRDSAQKIVDKIADEQGINPDLAHNRIDVAASHREHAQREYDGYNRWKNDLQQGANQEVARRGETGESRMDTGGAAPIDPGDAKAQKDEQKKQLEDYTKNKANTKGTEEEKNAAQAATLEGSRSSLGYIDMDDANKNIKVHYTYIGCLLEAVTHMLQPIQDGSMKSPFLMIGTLDYADPQNPTNVLKVPITDIPVSMKMYRWWLMKYMVQPMRDYVSVDDYINTLLVDLVGQVLKGDSNGCFAKSSGLANSVGVQSIARTHVSTDAGQKGADRIGELGDRFGDAQLKGIEKNIANNADASPVSLRAAALKHQYHYTVVNALFYVDETEIKGPMKVNTEEQDAQKGKYWIALRGDRGPVLSMTFEELDAQSENVSRSGNADQTAKYGMGLGYAVTAYGVKVKMVGNSLFKLGSTFFINSAAVGDIKSAGLAEMLGFGGDYMCKAVRGTIDESGWTTEIEGHPKGNNPQQQMRLERWNKHLAGEGALFQNQDITPNTIYETGQAIVPDGKGTVGIGPPMKGGAKGI